MNDATGQGIRVGNRVAVLSETGADVGAVLELREPGIVVVDVRQEIDHAGCALPNRYVLNSNHRHVLVLK